MAVSLNRYEPRFGIGMFELRKGNKSGLTSDQIRDQFKKKYKLDITEGNYSDPENLNSFFVEKKWADRMSKSLNKRTYKKRKGFWSNLFKPTQAQKNKNRLLLHALETGGVGKHGKIVMDDELRDRAPEVTAHELGHAVNHGVSPFRHFWNFAGHPATQVASGLLALPLTYYGINKKNKALAYSGVGLSALPALSQLSDEGMASYRAIKTMKEMGGKPKKSRLLKAYATYGIGNTPSIAESAILGSIVHKRFSPPKTASAPMYIDKFENNPEYLKLRNEAYKTGKIHDKKVSKLLSNTSKEFTSSIKPKLNYYLNKIKKNELETKPEFIKRRRQNTGFYGTGGAVLSLIPAYILAKKKGIDPQLTIGLGSLAGMGTGYMKTTLEGRKVPYYPYNMERDYNLFSKLQNPHSSEHKRYLKDVIDWEFKDPKKKSLYLTGKYDWKKNKKHKI